MVTITTHGSYSHQFLLIPKEILGNGPANANCQPTQGIKLCLGTTVVFPFSLSTLSQCGGNKIDHTGRNKQMPRGKLVLEEVVRRS